MRCLCCAVRCLNSQGGDPRTPELLREALLRVRAAPNSQGWGPKHPDGRLVAVLPTGDPAACHCKQPEMGQDPKRPEAHPYFGAWPPTQPLGLVCPSFASSRLCHVLVLLPCRWCGLLLQGADNSWCAVRAPDAVDRGGAARWWLNPSPSQCAALAGPACSGHAVVTRCPAASGGCSACRVVSPARGGVLPDKQPGKGCEEPLGSYSVRSV